MKLTPEQKALLKELLEYMGAEGIVGYDSEWANELVDEFASYRESGSRYDALDAEAATGSDYEAAEGADIR